LTRPRRDISGRIVAITGGARGIGAATARALTAAGARVAIGDLDVEQNGQHAGEPVRLHLNVTDHSGFTAFLDQVEHTLGPVDAPINNAGIMPVVEFDQETPASIQRQLDVNLHAVIHGTQQAVRRMKPRRRGHIINIASAAGKMGFAGVAT
jgi:NAD(P)-dependent dehydrogenase (short-subunit alcohol dehydrogenase family)